MKLSVSSVCGLARQPAFASPPSHWYPSVTPQPVPPAPHYHVCVIAQVTSRRPRLLPRMTQCTRRAVTRRTRQSGGGPGATTRHWRFWRVGVAWFLVTAFTHLPQETGIGSGNRTDIVIVRACQAFAVPCSSCVSPPVHPMRDASGAYKLDPDRKHFLVCGCVCHLVPCVSRL